MKMPVLFIGHGSPINIVSNNSYTQSLAMLGRALPKPEAILVISAHWQTRNTYIGCSRKPITIYDFYGFPEELYQVIYNCPGAPEKASLVQAVTNGKILSDYERGLDHAAWAVLKHMYPDANIPVMEMSLDVMKSPQGHYEMGKKLAPLRNEGILILGSGNMVHNLSKVNFEELYGDNYPWAVQCDSNMAELIVKGDHASLINYQQLPNAKLAIPTNEHYLPMLYALALQEEDDTLDFTCADMQNGSISMRSFIIAERK